MSNRPSAVMRVVSVSNDDNTRLLCITIAEWTGNRFDWIIWAEFRKYPKFP